MHFAKSVKNHSRGLANGTACLMQAQVILLISSTQKSGCGVTESHVSEDVFTNKLSCEKEAAEPEATGAEPIVGLGN